MCEQMGWEPKEEEIPRTIETISEEAQQAVLVFNILPDRIEGMSGSWLGKDLSPLASIMDIYEIEDKRYVLELLLVIQQEYRKYYSEQQKAREAKSKIKGR